MSAEQLTQLALESDPGLSEFFLGRLASLVARQVATVSPAERMVLSVAAFSLFLDCVDLGLGAEAQAIVGQLRDDEEPVERMAA